MIAAFTKPLIAWSLSLIICGTSIQAQDNTQGKEKGLKDYYAEIFPVGASISPRDVSGPEAALILKQFSSLTAENMMKMGPIHPEEDSYNWEPADQIANFATQNGLLMRGHTLCWHNQTPRWLFTDDDGAEVTKDVLLARLKEHITAVVSRYKGKVYAWDVVNEAIDDNPGNFLRNSKWYQIGGEEFIAKAFQYAHEADPNALLFYNDYNAVKPGKRDNIYRLLSSLIEAKVPVHGVGIQGHWSVYEPSEKDLRDAIEKYASLGLQIHITELDVSIYPKEGRREPRESDVAEFTPELEKLQRDKYNMLFRVFRDYKDSITSVTFWNVSDRHSWLDNFPVRGRKDFPLLFDQELQPKKAFWEVVKF